MNNLDNQEILSVPNDYYADMKAALLRLQHNKDFQKVILQGYFQDKAINGVSVLATEHVKQNGLRSDVMEDLIAISRLQDYFQTIVNLGPATLDELESDDDE